MGGWSERSSTGTGRETGVQRYGFGLGSRLASLFDARMAAKRTGLARGRSSFAHAPPAQRDNPALRTPWRISGNFGVRAGRPGAFNSSCLSHVCAPRGVGCRTAGGGTPHVGSSTMPRPASRSFAFEAEQIRVMHRAFEAVCAELQLSIGLGDRVTELVGQRIIELAMAGERDADRLTARVLAEFGIENDGSLWRH